MWWDLDSIFLSLPTGNFSLGPGKLTSRISAAVEIRLVRGKGRLGEGEGTKLGEGERRLG